MRIGELAQASAVSRDTLRFYEQRGLVAAQRSANGYRDYPAEMVQRGCTSRPLNGWALPLAKSVIALPRYVSRPSQYPLNP
ncbi:hypothetical protein J3D54_000937 [Pseudomonas sp. GGS8]|nr:hypothetical protein [Pseudomonas sp. GGS8]